MSSYFREIKCRGSFLLWATALALLGLGLGSCQPSGDAGENEAAADSASAPPVVDITAADYAFVAPDTIPAGWVTFRMTNKGTETHHFVLRPLLEGMTVADWREAIKEPLDSVNQLRGAGKIDSAEAGKAFKKAFDRATPDSLTGPSDVHAQPRGGMTGVAPGRTGRVTQRVEPGHYEMLCFIRAPSGRSHVGLGMVDGLVAVESSVGRSPPTPDVTVRAAGREIRMDGPLSSGTRTIGFSVEEVPEGLQGGTEGYYFVTLARLGDTTTAREAAAWDFRNPAPYEGLGGLEFIPPNEESYLTADVQSGRYAWIWSYAGMDLLGDDEPIVREFTVE